MKTKFLSIIFVLTFALPLKAINRNEHYIVGKFNILNPAITIDSETVSFEKNSEITTEILLKNNSKNVIDTEVSIKISPLGNGIPFTKGLLPDNFSIYDNGMPLNFYIKYKNDLYIPKEAENINCYEDSLCLFNIKLLSNEQKKITIKYRNVFIGGSSEYVVLYHIFSAEKNKILKTFQTEENIMISNFYESDYIESEYIPSKKQICTYVKRINYDNDFYYQIEIPETIEVIRCDITDIQCNIIVNRNLSSKNFAIVQFNEINCSEEILSKADLFFLRKEDLSFLRNCFYAAHGYIFKNKKLMEEFTRRYEYQGFSYPFNSNFSETDLNEIEKTNINLIKEMENMKEPILLSDLQ